MPPKKSDRPSINISNDDPASHDKKKGISKFFLNEAEEQKYLSYELKKPGIIDWENIKLSD